MGRVLDALSAACDGPVNVREPLGDDPRWFVTARSRGADFSAWAPTLAEAFGLFAASLLREHGRQADAIAASASFLRAHTGLHGDDCGGCDAMAAIGSLRKAAGKEVGAVRPKP